MRAPLAVAAAGIVLSGCRGAEPTRRAPPAVSGAGKHAGAVATSRWDTAAGVALVINTTPDESLAAVVLPDIGDRIDGPLVTRRARALGAWSVDLLGRGGVIGTSSVDSVTDAGGDCPAWPAARVAPGLARPWAVGIAHGRAVVLPLDSMERLARADSAALAATIARIVSALPGDTVGVFRGLPYTVREAWLFDLPARARVVVADVLRVLNEEANPREERIFLLAEREAEASDWQAAYFERDWGPEDQVASVDVLAVVALGAARTPTVVISRDVGSTTVYGLLQRSGEGSWQVRWTSAPSGC